eukprot:7058680-Prymnesium_polylepis.1
MCVVGGVLSEGPERCGAAPGGRSCVEGKFLLVLATSADFENKFRKSTSGPMNCCDPWGPANPLTVSSRCCTAIRGLWSDRCVAQARALSSSGRQ